MQRSLALLEPAMRERVRRAFLSHYRINGDCWDWTIHNFKRGYGVFTIRGGPHKRYTYYGHRISYEMFIGPIPHFAVIVHTCGRRQCVNPDHLRLGEHKERLAQALAVSAKQQPAIPPVGVQSLREQDIRTIRERYVNEHDTIRDILREYNITRSTLETLIHPPVWIDGSTPIARPKLPRSVSWYDYPNGERSPYPKLTWEQIREIRQRSTQQGVTKAALAKEYGIGKSTMQRIIERSAWNDED